MFRIIIFFSFAMLLSVSGLAQIELVKDINTELTTDLASTPSQMVQMDSVFYFAATDGIHGTELWRSNGTAGGTWMVKDINPSTLFDGISGTCYVFDNNLYFS